MKRVELENLNNTRDLGGIRTAAGYIVPGRLIRSGQLFMATDSDISWLTNNIDTVIDFRTVSEMAEMPDPVLEGVDSIHIPIVEEIAAGVSRDKRSDQEALRILASNPEHARRHMCGIYEEFIVLDSARRGYEAFIRKLLEDNDGAMLWHCTVGKDRAGFATVLVLEILGADRETITANYLKTNDYIAADVGKMVEKLTGIKGPVDERTETALRYMLGAHEEYLESAYAKAEELYGGIEGYIRDALHIDDTDIEAFRQKYLGD